MSNGGEAADQVVRMTLEGVEVAVKITGAAGKNLTAILAALMRQDRKTRGKARLDSLLRSGKELTIFSIPAEDQKEFIRQAKAYGILYCVVKDRQKNGLPVDILTRSEDAPKVQRVMDRLAVGRIDKQKIEESLAEEKKEKAKKEMPDKTKGELIVEKALETENPSEARESADLPSGPHFEEADVSDKEIRQDTLKPSVRTKLQGFQKEAVREKAAVKEKENTVYRNRKRVQKKRKNRKER